MLLGRRRRKDVPEAERFIRSRGKNGTAFRAQGQVKDTVSVALKLLDGRHGRVFPQAQVIAGKAVGRKNFFLKRIPLQGTDLRSGIDGIQDGASARVPELDGAIGRSTARSQQVAFVRGPSQSFDRRLMFRQLETRLRTARLGGVPQANKIVVATTGERVAVRAPRQTADLLAVSFESRDIVTGDTDVMVDNGTVRTATRKVVTIPRQRTDTGRVSIHVTDTLAFVGVPQLRHPGRNSHRQMRPTFLHPFYGGNVRVRTFVERAKLLNVAGARIPKVDRLVQGDRQHILFVPADEVKVKVVLKIGCVENTTRGRRNVARHQFGAALFRV